MTLGDRIKEVRGDMSRVEFANRLSDAGVKVDQSNITKYESGKIRPSADFFVALRTIFGTDLNWFVTGDGSPSVLKSEKKKIEDNDISKDVKSIRVFGEVMAGTTVAMWSNEEFIMKIKFPQIEKLKGNLFGFIVRGDSMRPRFTEKDLVISKLSPINEIRNRDFVVTNFRTDVECSEANLKLFTWKDKTKNEFILSSLNTQYLPTVHRVKDVINIFRVYTVISEIHYK